MSVGAVTPAPRGGTNIDAVVSDKKNMGVSVEDFLNMMVQQLANQDFMNPVDDAQYLTQLAQFASMQEMQNLAYYSQSNYVMSLIGKDVTVAQLTLGGNVTKETGPVEKVSLVDGEYQVFVKGKGYRLDQLMEIHAPAVDKPEKPDDGGTTEDLSKVISYSNVTSHSAEIKWTKKDDENMRYSVYYSKEPNFESVEDVKKGTLMGEAERKNLNREILTNLEQGTVYYVNVVATDADGKETVYSKTKFTTALEPKE